MSEDPGRVTTAEIFSALGIEALSDRTQAYSALAKPVPVFMPIGLLAPKIHQLLQVRRVLGLRNSTHTLVKIMQPFQQAALRLVSYTHPEYLPVLTTYFLTVADPARGDVFLMRGTEGETVAHPRRANAVTWLHQGQVTELIERQAPNDELPILPAASDAQTTAAWIKEALAGQQPIPAPITAQLEHCLNVARQLRA
jgi:anthranilate phosphoribosyltransferase